MDNSDILRTDIPQDHFVAGSKMVFLIDNERHMKALRKDLARVYWFIDSGRCSPQVISGLRVLASIISDTILKLREVREW